MGTETHFICYKKFTGKSSCVKSPWFEPLKNTANTEVMTYSQLQLYKL